MIWQSQAVCNPRGEWVIVLEVPTSKERALRSDLDSALQTKSVIAVQLVLPENAQDEERFNKAIVGARKQILEADYISELGWHLALDLRYARQRGLFTS